MTEHHDSRITRFAAWHERFLAYVVDVGPLVIMYFVLALFDPDTEMYSAADPGRSSSGVNVEVSGLPALLLFVVTLGWFVYNWLIRQGATGQTVGKKVMEIVVLDAARQPIGAGLTFVRQLAHVLDFLPCFLGYLWPCMGRGEADLRRHDHGHPGAPRRPQAALRSNLTSRAR
jgi:uncharacterized RDD family membrane protein YckC